MTTKFLDEEHHKVYIEIHSRRVYRLFCEVWETLPPTVKACVFERVMQITDMAIGEKSPKGKDAGGRTRMNPGGSEILLFSRHLRKHSDAIVRYVIAHEIAHAILHNKHQGEVLEGDNVDWMEDTADTAAREWGFPRPSELDQEELINTHTSERAATIERAITVRLPDFDIGSDKYPPPVAGRMRRALRKSLAQLKRLLEEPWTSKP